MAPGHGLAPSQAAERAWLGTVVGEGRCRVCPRSRLRALKDSCSARSFGRFNATQWPLRVLPGTHTLGVLSDDEIHNLANCIAPFDCVVRRGGILAMRPLIVHSSSKSRVDAARRVLHLEYTASEFLAEGLELAIA